MRGENRYGVGDWQWKEKREGKFQQEYKKKNPHISFFIYFFGDGDTSLERKRQVDLCEFDTNLAYIVLSQPGLYSKTIKMGEKIKNFMAPQHPLVGAWLTAAPWSLC